MIRSYVPYVTIPQMPMSISYIFYELHTNGDTGVVDVLPRLVKDVEVNSSADRLH